MVADTGQLSLTRSLTEESACINKVCAPYVHGLVCKLTARRTKTVFRPENHSQVQVTNQLRLSHSTTSLLQ